MLKAVAGPVEISSGSSAFTRYSGRVETRKAADEQELVPTDLPQPKPKQQIFGIGQIPAKVIRLMFAQVS
jgi:hypothetical protein